MKKSVQVSGGGGGVGTKVQGFLRTRSKGRGGVVHCPLGHGGGNRAHKKGLGKGKKKDLKEDGRHGGEG